MSLNPPTPPGPDQAISSGTQVAGQQQGLNTQSGVESQAGSMVNQGNQYGNINYTQTGVGPNGVPIYSANTSLNPTQQALYNQLTGTQSAAGGIGSGLLSSWEHDYGGEAPSKAIGDMYSGLTSQMMGREVAAQKPYFDTQTSQLQAQLANEGFTMNDPASVNAMRNLQGNQNQAIQGFEASQFMPTMNAATQQYQLPLTDAAQIASWTGPQSPTSQAVNAPGLNIQPANLIGATANMGNLQEQQYKNQMDQYSGMMNGIFGIGSDALGVMTGGMSLPFTSGLQSVPNPNGGGYAVGYT
jgi:hypothetical protein